MELCGKCPSVWFIRPLAGMTKGVSEPIRHVLLLYGQLSRQFDCSAYDRSVSDMFYIPVVIFHSQEFAGSSMEMHPLLYRRGLFLTSQSENLHQNIT